MKNLTVNDLIDILKKLDGNAVVCNSEDFEYFTSQDVYQIDNISYTDDDGDTARGNIVVIN